MIKTQSIYTILGRLSKREKFIFYAAALFVSVTLLDRIIISPIFSRMKRMEEDTREMETQIRNDLRILSHKDRIEKESKEYGSFFEKPKTDDEEMSSILKEVENTANRTSIYLIDLKPAEITEVGVSKVYRVNLNCEAQMEQLVDFMYNIESSNKLLIIERYQINPKSKESSVARCRMTISKVAIP